MKKIAVAAALICMTALPALAQSAPPGPPPGAEGGPPGGGPGGNGQHFEEIKQKILQRIQEREACVQAAKDPEALRGCAPHRGEHGGPGGGFAGARSPQGGQGQSQGHGPEGDDGLPQ